MEVGNSSLASLLSSVGDQQHCEDRFAKIRKRLHEDDTKDDDCIVLPKKSSEDNKVDLTGMLKTELLELTTGDDIVEEANQIFNAKLKDGGRSGPKVSMAFKFIKKSGNASSKSSGKKPKRIKVIITSKKTLAAAMAAAAKGQDPAEVMLQLNRATESSSGKSPRVNKKKKALPPPSPQQSSWDQVEKTSDIPNGLEVEKEEVGDFEYETRPQIKERKNKMEEEDEVVKREIKEDPDFIDEDEEDYDEDEEEDEGDDFDDEDEEDVDDPGYLEKPRRGRKPKTESSASKRKRRKLLVPNTLDKSRGLSYMDLDSYVVKVSAKWPRASDKAHKTDDDDVEVEDEEELEEVENEVDSDNVENDDVISQLGDRKIYGCVFCDYTGRKQNWLIHLKSKHKDKGILFCSRSRLCSMPFQSQELLDRHAEEAHGNRHSCEICHKQFKFPSGLKNHAQSHLSEDSAEKRKHICPYCGKKFSTRTGYRSHEAHTHTMNLRHKCDWEGCEKAYFSLTDLVIHKRGHTGECPYTCSYCGAGFVAKQRLVQHERIMHLNTGKMDVECEVCHKKIRKKHLSYHLKTHQGLTKAWCSVCGKEFPTSGGKKRHEKIHFNVKNHACRFCGKSFVQKANMDAHERIHTGVKPYSCKHCGECFVQGTRRNQHQNSCRHKPATSAEEEEDEQD